MNDQITIESLIHTYNQEGLYNIIYEKDPYILYYTGFMIIKNSEWTRSFFEESYNHVNHMCFDQGSIDWLRRNDWNNSQKNILVLEHYCGLNQYWHTYRPRDFIIHFPGSREPCMVPNTLGKFMNMYCPLKMDQDTDESYQKRIEWLSGEVLNYNREEYDKCTKIGRVYPLDFYQ